MDKGLQGGKIMQGKFSDYLLVSDMDATLLDDNHTISEENRQAIDYFIKNGGRFTVATGRMVEAVRAYMPNLHINAPAVLHNGAKIYDYEKDCAVFERFIEENRKQAIKRVYDDFPQIGLEVYSDEIVYVYRECEETKRFLTRSYEVVYSLPDEICLTSTSRYTEPNMITAMRSEAVTSILTLLRTEFQRVRECLIWRKKSVLSRTKL